MTKKIERVGVTVEGSVGRIGPEMLALMPDEVRAELESMTGNEIMAGWYFLCFANDQIIHADGPYDEPEAAAEAARSWKTGLTSFAERLGFGILEGHPNESDESLNARARELVEAQDNAAMREAGELIRRVSQLH